MKPNIRSLMKVRTVSCKCHAVVPCCCTHSQNVPDQLNLYEYELHISRILF